MTITDTPTPEALPLSIRTMRDAADRTTEAVKALHRWLRNVLIWFIILTVAGAAWTAYEASQAAVHVGGISQCIADHPNGFMEVC